MNETMFIPLCSRRRRCGGQSGHYSRGGGGRAASVLLPDVMEAAKWGPLEWLESCGCRGAGRQPVARPGPGGT